MEKVRLEEISPQNFKECIGLKVSDAQANFVASNLFSIAQSKVYPTMNPKAIYADDEMVGFTLYGFDPDDCKFYLARLMIDERFQGRGFGKAAILQIIEELRAYEDCREIFLSFAPENADAEALYKKIGFERTGETNEYDEIVMRYELHKTAGNERRATPN